MAHPGSGDPDPSAAGDPKSSGHQQTPSSINGPPAIMDRPCSIPSARSKEKTQPKSDPNNSIETHPISSPVASAPDQGVCHRPDPVNHPTITVAHLISSGHLASPPSLQQPR
ncbi:hypothetical protein ACLOJK_036527, partial [Asimina triloba]